MALARSYGPPGHAMAGYMGMAGLSGGNPAQFQMSKDGRFDPRFMEGKPGIYAVTFRVQAVQLSAPQTALQDTKPYTDALRLSGIKGRVTKVRYLRNENPRDKNWADSAMRDILGQDTSGNLVADRIYEVTVVIDPETRSEYEITNAMDSPYMSGMGAVPGVVVGAAILAGIAVVLAGVWYLTGKNILADGARLIGEAVGGLITGAGRELTENAIPIMIGIGVIALALTTWKKFRKT